MVGDQEGCVIDKGGVVLCNQGPDAHCTLKPGLVECGVDQSGTGWRNCLCLSSALNWAEDPEAKAKRLGVGKRDRGDVESEVVKSVSTSQN